MATNYVTQSELSKIISAEQLAIAAADNDGTLDSVRIEAAITASSEQVDAELRALYQIPLTEVSDFIKVIVARIAHAELIDDYVEDGLIDRRQKKALTDLRRISSGAARIGAAGQGAGITNKSQASVFGTNVDASRDHFSL